MAIVTRPQDRQWETADVRGVAMGKCPLWEGRHDTRAGLYRMPAGMQIPEHHHSRWVQIYVVEGAMRIDEPGGTTHDIPAGGYYFVEPSETHVETAVVDTVVLVIQDEDRPGKRSTP